MGLSCLLCASLFIACFLAVSFRFLPVSINVAAAAEAAAGVAGARDSSRLPHFFAHPPPPQRIASPVPNYPLCLLSTSFISHYFVISHYGTFVFRPGRHPCTCHPPVPSGSSRRLHCTGIGGAIATYQPITGSIGNQSANQRPRLRTSSRRQPITSRILLLGQSAEGEGVWEGKKTRQALCMMCWRRGWVFTLPNKRFWRIRRHFCLLDVKAPGKVRKTVRPPAWFFDN